MAYGLSTSSDLLSIAIAIDLLESDWSHVVDCLQSLQLISGNVFGGRPIKKTPRTLLFNEEKYKYVTVGDVY